MTANSEPLGRIVEIRQDSEGLVVVVAPKDDEARDIMLRNGFMQTPFNDDGDNA